MIPDELREIEERSIRALGDEPDRMEFDNPAYHDMWIDWQREVAADAQRDALLLARTLRNVLEVLDDSAWEESGLEWGNVTVVSVSEVRDVIEATLGGVL